MQETVGSLLSLSKKTRQKRRFFSLGSFGFFPRKRRVRLMSEMDDAIQAIDDVKNKLDAVAGLGDIATQLNTFKDKLSAVGNLGDTAQKSTSSKRI